MSQKTVDVLRAVYGEWAKGNFQVGRDLWDQHVLFISAADLPGGGVYIGPEGIEEFMRGFLKAWTSFSIVAEELIEAGNSVVVVAHQRGVGQTSGLDADMGLQFQVWTFRGDSVIRFEAFGDRAEALAAVGLRE